MEVRLYYHGHSCFTLEADGYRTVIDPYAWGMVPGQKDLHLVADAIYCSHDHADHNFKEAVGQFLALKEPPYTLTEFDTAHDDQDGALRGRNTVRIFDFDGLRIAHLGDLGCFPEGALEEALQDIDCMLLPVGGYYTIGVQTAWQIVRGAKPRVVIPMHYRTDATGFEELSHIDDFAKLFRDVQEADGGFTLTKETPNQILILHQMEE